VRTVFLGVRAREVKPGDLVSFEERDAVFTPGRTREINVRSVTIDTCHGTVILEGTDSSTTETFRADQILFVEFHVANGLIR
jgi:hypothetical protein